MITQMTVKRFKSHKDVALTGLKRINLLLGKNNAGKSSLLEALFYALTPDNPKAGFELLNEARGILPNDYVWISVFHHLAAQQPVEISLANQQTSTTLRILPLLGNKVAQDVSGAISGGLGKSDPDGLRFEYASGTSQTAQNVTAQQGRGERSRNQNYIDNLPVIFVPARAHFDSLAAARRFSALKAKQCHQMVVEAIKTLDDRLTGVEVLATKAGVELFGNIGEPQMVPLSWMGEGMLRILSLASAVASVQGGVVLVDEIENGIHYSVMPAVWATLMRIAEELNVQVFAVTHSDEMIRAVLSASASLKMQDSLRAYRCDLVNGATQITDYDATLLLAAVESEQEVR